MQQLRLNPQKSKKLLKLLGGIKSLLGMIKGFNTEIKPKRLIYIVAEPQINNPLILKLSMKGIIGSFT